MSTSKQVARPQYPSITDSVVDFLLMVTRAPILCAVAAHYVVGPVYYSFIEAYSMSDALAFTLFLWGTQDLVFIVAHGFFASCDYYNLLQQHKLPRKPYMKPSRELIVSTINEELFGMLVVQPIALYLTFSYLLSMPSQATQLPSISECALHIVGALITNEVLFYIAHRTFHEVPLLYKIHKKHHEYRGTISIAAQHANPIEDVVANITPTLLYVLYMRLPTPLISVWLLCRIWETYESHSGYCFKKTWLAKIGLLNSARAEFHDFHHTANIGNFGTNLFLDRMLHTQDEYLCRSVKA
jgi:sterol desaturase/sphingolipid hydroxylase (fatty acid hydroxylase superfamily)